MALLIESEPIPLKVDANGIGSRWRAPFDPNGVRDRLLARCTKQVENSRNGETDVAASC